MTIRRILTEPDPVLRQKSQPVDKVDDSVKKLMDDMVETMYDAPGIGLAAIQVGVPKIIFVLFEIKLELEFFLVNIYFLTLERSLKGG